MRPFRLIFLAILSAGVLVSAGEAQKKCTKGKPCGNTCIAQDKECHVGTTPVAKPTTSPAPVPLSTPASGNDPDKTTVTGPSADHTRPWVASPNGRTYYKNIKSCSGGWKLKSKIYFRTPQDAEAAGYTRSTQKKC